MKRMVFVLLFMLLFYSPCHAAEKKNLVALIDFVDETPNKMMVMSGEKLEDNRAYLPEVMQVVRGLAEKSGLFELLPPEKVAEGMKTRLGREAAARRYDGFSAARFGRMLGVDALLTGEIIQFEKNVLTNNLSISGVDFSGRVGDVVIKARLVSSYNGEELAAATGVGVADENLLESVTAAIVNRLSIGFLQATKMSTESILNEFRSADIKIRKEYVSPVVSPADIINFTVTQADGKYIYINAGRGRNVSIADLFTILKKDEVGNLKPVAVYRVITVEADASRLVLVEPEEAAGTVLVGDKAQRKIGRAEIKFEN